MFFIFFSLFISLCLGSSDLSRHAVCKGEDSLCQAGLVCRQTKAFTVQGQTFPVNQCVAHDEVIDVESVNMDAENDVYNVLTRHKRSIPGTFKQCQTESDCPAKFCCVNLLKTCFPKPGRGARCTTQTQNLLSCPCQDGLKCQTKATTTLPITGILVPQMQCEPPPSVRPPVRPPFFPPVRPQPRA
ncbi:uncharacterized protein LOC114968220 [Acropora millepora]|uniref:uncharacterized protein LOC114968220 n=1 Tax=Acropora millepora TaxID=45264 RepID=UPI001CF43AEA|nr:uncharacterized protein LOC114968220 [Acropora millepora]